MVFGIDHPYQVAAIALANGTVAAYDPSDDGQPADAHWNPVEAKIQERVHDVSFVLGQITKMTADRTLLDGRLDLGRIGLVGHSNGGITAAEKCHRDDRCVPA